MQDWHARWRIQLLLPLLYPCFCTVHCSINFLLSRLATEARFPTKHMMRSGWLPRTDFSRRALSLAYVPNGLFYFNLYFYSGASNAFQMLICEQGDNGKQYLSAHPSTVCWEGVHAVDAGLACCGVVFYYVMIPIAYYRVLLVYIPSVGRANKWATAYFGFLYTRFMPELWFWEIVELGRKVRGSAVERIAPPQRWALPPRALFQLLMQADFYSFASSQVAMIIITTWGKRVTPLTQCFLAMCAVMCVMIAELAFHPFQVIPTPTRVHPLLSARHLLIYTPNPLCTRRLGIGIGDSGTSQDCLFSSNVRAPHLMVYAQTGLHDVLEEYSSFVEFIVLLLGLVVNALRSEDTAGGTSDLGWVDALIWFFLVSSLVFVGLVALADMRKEQMERFVFKLRSKVRCAWDAADSITSLLMMRRGIEGP